MTDGSGILLRHHDAAGTLALREPVLRVYGASHAEPIRENPWFSEERFWQRLVELYPPSRDFAMVSGYGRQIHDALLRGRPERLACLNVRVDNAPATAAYLSWGWCRIASEQPFPDSPVLHVMARPLPL